MISAGLFDEKLIWGEDYEFYFRLKRMRVKEAWCKSNIYHYEPKTLIQILHKTYRYGKSMPNLDRINGQIPLLLIRQTYLTAKEMPKNVPKSFPSRIGILVLLYFKVLATIAGLLLSP